MISIIIPVYNSEKYLKECLESVKNQTYFNFECIIVDDGSTDASGQICDLFCSEDTRFQVYHNDNHGVSFSRNFGIEKASGTYLTFIDSDDIVDVKMLEKLVDGIEQKGADICFCKYDLFDENGTYPVVEEKLVSTEVNNDAEFFEKFLKYFFISHVKTNEELQMGSSWRILFKRDLLLYKFNENIRISEDLLFVLNNLVGLKKIEVINETLYHYRQIESSASRKYKKGFVENQNKLILSLSDFMSRLSFTTTQRQMLNAEYCVHACFSFINEIKFRKGNRDTYRINIQECKKTKIYSYLSLSNIFKIKHRKWMLRCLAIWFLVKTGIFNLI